MSLTSAHDPQLARLTDAIAQRVGPQRYKVWFNPDSARFDLKQDGLEIAVANDFISEWISDHYTRPIQEAAHEVMGCSLPVRLVVVPQLFESKDDVAPAAASVGPGARGKAVPEPGGRSGKNGRAGAVNGNGHAKLSGNGADGEVSARKAVDFYRPTPPPALRATPAPNGSTPSVFATRPSLRHDLETFVVGQSNQLAYNAAAYVAEFPGSQYNPLFIHGSCGLGKTHLLQGLCRRFAEHHPTKRWMYLTGEDFTNEFLNALKSNKIDTFRRKVRDLDVLVIDDVHFLSGKKATQEEFLHTFNAIEATGRQVVMASDNHPKMTEEFGEALINRFVSGMVVRIDPPNYATRCEILRAIMIRQGLGLSEEVIGWIARRVTQNVRELEGAVTRIAAHVELERRPADVLMAQQALGDLDRQLVAPVKPENILNSVCNYFGLEHKDLMSGRRQRTISLARSVAMFLVRKTAKLSFPEIGMRMGKRNHSTVISACRRIERAVEKNESLVWSSAVGEREEEAAELIQRLEEHSRAMS